MKITIDGPAGSGKSYIAKELSKKLNIPYLETGLAYRAVGYAVLESLGKVETLSWEDLKPFAEELKVIPLVGRTKVLMGGRELKEDVLRSEEVGRMASLVGTVPQFRKYVNDMFREAVGEGQAVVEGRDAGTNIFPKAEVKLFITASAQERAKRRWKQLREAGIEVSYEDILRKVEERDRRDTSRRENPLRPAEDAIVIDTTGMSPEESLRLVLSIVKGAEDEEAT